MAEDLTWKSGLIIPENVKHPSCQGRVLAVGPEVRDVRVGDVVLFEPYQEQQYLHDPQFEDDELLLMPESDVMAHVVQPVPSPEEIDNRGFNLS